MRFICLCLISHTALADDTLAAARAHLNAGIAYYDEARYDEAVREMEAAYRLRPVAELQYNLAECYERLGRFDDAVQAYKKYLAGAPGAVDGGSVEARIANLEKRAPATPRERVVFKTIVVYRDAPPPPGRGARWAAWGVGALGAGGLAAGIACAVLAANAYSQEKTGANTSMPGPFDAKNEDRGQTMTAISGVGFGVAVLGAAGATALYFLGRKIDREAKREQVRLDAQGVHF